VYFCAREDGSSYGWF
nr:immunoglobulin heavy chain junction region [Mus musculus]